MQCRAGLGTHVPGIAVKSDLRRTGDATQGLFFNYSDLIHNLEPATFFEGEKPGF